MNTLPVLNMHFEFKVMYHMLYIFCAVGLNIQVLFLTIVQSKFYTPTCQCTTIAHAVNTGYQKTYIFTPSKIGDN